jgi:short-subunit dehydrogenase
LTKSAAAYYAPYKIRVNAVAPGLVETPMSKRAQENEEICAYIRTKQALSGGFLSADDVAAAALFLLSDDARHITGEVLTVDGGWRFGDRLIRDVVRPALTADGQVLLVPGLLRRAVAYFFNASSLSNSITMMFL